jgi:glutaredoxin
MKPPKWRVNSWNKRVSVGDKVIVHLDSGKERETTTRSKAQLLANKVPVIWLNGIHGCYSLDRVERIKERKKDGKRKS